MSLYIDSTTFSEKSVKSVDIKEANVHIIYRLLNVLIEHGNECPKTRWQHAGASCLNVLKKFMPFMVSRKLIQIDTSHRRHQIVRITKKGVEFCHNMESIYELLEMHPEP